MYIEFLDIIISAVIFSGMGQGKDSGKLLFRKIFSDGSINITEGDTSLTFSSIGGSGAAILQDRVAIGTGTGITHSFICVGEISPIYGGFTNVRSVRGSYDLTRSSYNTGQHSFIIGGSTNSVQNSSYYSTIVGGQTNSIVKGGNDLIIGGSCNIVNGFKRSGNKIFGGYTNEIQSYNSYGEIFGGKLNRLCNDGTLDMYGNKIIGGQQNEIACASERSVILGGVTNCVLTNRGSFAGGNLSTSNLILSSYNSSVYTGASYYTPFFPPSGLLNYESKYNNIVGSRKSTITSRRSSYRCAPKYTNIIGGCKNEMSGWYSNVLSGLNNYVIGNTDYNNTNNYSHMQIISSACSKICGTLYANIISSYGSTLLQQSRVYSRNIVSSFLSQGTAGGNLFSTSLVRSLNNFGLASGGGKFCGATRVISSSLPPPSNIVTATVSTSMIISSDLDFFSESFGVDGFSTQTFCPGANNNVYPQQHSLILSSSLVMNYNSFTSRTFFAGDQHSTSIISSNKILSGYNLKAPSYFPTFRPEGMSFDNGRDDPMTLLDNTLMISNYCSCQRTNANSLMISTINSRMSNGLFNSIIGGDSNQIKSFGPGFYNNGCFNAEGDNDGRILRAIFGGEVKGIDLGLSRHNMILAGSYNGFYSICGQTLEIGTAGPGLLLNDIAFSGDLLEGEPLRRSMNTRYSSIIGGCCNRIIADIGTATPSGKNKGVVCNPILNSVILGSCGKEMRISNHTGVDNLIISGIPWGGTNSNGQISPAYASFGISGTFSNPTSISVCRGFVVAVTSDFRLKIIIQKIGQSNSNLNIYLFKYISDPEKIYQGVIAQELLNTKYESAVSTGRGGFYQVDYSKIDVEFKEVSMTEMTSNSYQ